MREVFDDPERARERGLRGKEAVESRQSVERAAAFLAERVPQLESLRAERDAHETPGSRAARFLAFGPSLSWDAPSRSGIVGKYWRRVLMRLLRPYLVRQRELETLLASGVEDLERSRDRLDEAVRELQSLATDSRTRVVRLSEELHAEPYMAEPEVAGASAYVAFEEIFRGPEERVRGLLGPYVELLRGHEPVLDVGCGRGELLELLTSAGIEARGVDVDEGMVERSRAKGLAVEQADAVSYLERQPEGSFGAIVAVHVIEHLAYEELQRLLELARRALRPGGLFVAETVNPHSVQAFKTFWVDPTHRAPIFPEVASALALIHGFSDAEIIYPRGSGDAEADRFGQTEYALVAS
jgi:SAM-dependent methyltransferase